YLQVGRLHVRCLDRGFLATLGEGFLSLMYEAMDRADGVTLITEERDGRVVGFITGGTGLGPIYKRMLRSPVRLGLALAPALVRPAKVRRIIEILRYSGDAALPDGVPEAELLSLAVTPEAEARAWRSRCTGSWSRISRRAAVMRSASLRAMPWCRHTASTSGWAPRWRGRWRCMRGRRRKCMCTG